MKNEVEVFCSIKQNGGIWSQRLENSQYKTNPTSFVMVTQKNNWQAWKKISGINTYTNNSVVLNPSNGLSNTFLLLDDILTKAFMDICKSS